MEREGETPIQALLEIDEARDIRTILGPWPQHGAADNKAWEEDRKDSTLSWSRCAYCQEALCQV